MRRSFEIALFAVIAASVFAGCGRSRRRNVPEGEERVVKAKAPEAGNATNQSGASTAAPPVSAEAARLRATLRRLGERFDAAKTPEDRADAVEKIGQLGAAALELTPALDRAADDADPLVRSFAVRARAAVGDVGAEAAISKALLDKDESVRVAAAESLAAAAEPFRLKAVALVARRDPSSRVQETLMATLRADPTAETAGVVAALINDQSNPGVEFLSLRAVRDAARILAVRPAEGRAAAEALSVYLGRHDPELRRLVAETLGALGVRSKVVRTALIGALTDPESEVRKTAFETLKIWAGNGFGFDPNSSGTPSNEAIRAFSAWSEGKE